MKEQGTRNSAPGTAYLILFSLIFFLLIPSFVHWQFHSPGATHAVRVSPRTEVSKKLGELESRTYTVVGTPHYMAPEAPAKHQQGGSGGRYVQGGWPLAPPNSP